MMNHIKVFCIPYAGGSAVTYERWKKRIPDKNDMDFIPLELAGRGRKSNLPFYENIEEAVEDLYQSIRSELYEPYAIFGHSMGSLIAFELCHKLQEKGLPGPEHIFFSGRRSPFIPSPNHNFHMLSDEEFVQEVLNYGGTTRQALEHTELRELFLPILRADFKLVETYQPRLDRPKFSANISAFGGKRDVQVTLEDLQSWGETTTGQCRTSIFPGNHFFINESLDDVIMKIYIALYLERIFRVAIPGN
jgi:medium-chain acyl-[acyl-carrier-protein] hydrolase